jgi:hypothetical protein
MQPPARNLSALAGPLYAVAVMLIVVPFLEVGTQLGWSISPSMLNWRTGAVGLLSSATLTPTFGLVVAVVTASVFDHRWMQRVLIAVAGLAALTCVVLLFTFVLDSVQLRPTVTEAVRRTYTIAMIKAMLNITLAIVALTIVFVGALKARTKVEKGSGRRAQDTVLVVPRPDA